MEQQNDFIVIEDKDSEGAVAGIIYLNRSNIAQVMYNAVQNVMLLILHGAVSRTGIGQHRLLNKQGEETNAYAQGVVTITDQKTITFDDPEIIVRVHKFLTGEDVTMDSYKGFQYHQVQLAAMEKFKAEKEKEEQDTLLADENKRRGSLQLPLYETYEAMMAEKEQSESTEKAGQSPVVPLKK